MKDAAIALFLFAANLLAVARYFLADFSAEVWNNDYLYTSMARMFRDRPWTWNSLQYGGAPLTYLYPPIIQVLMDAVPAHSLGRSYHVVGALSYALVPVALYVLGRVLFSSRALAAMVALAYSFLPSPAYYLLPLWKGIAAGYHNAPWGFIAMVVYSEAAHALALVAVLLAAAAAWRNRWVLASLAGAAAFLINWAGVVGLLMALAALAAARTRDLGYRGAAWRILCVAGTAYGLAAFWITPGFLRTTGYLNRVVLRHEQLAAPWTAYTWLIIACAAALMALSLWKRIPARAAFALSFATLAGVAPAALNAAGNYLLPLPHRYVLELNVALLLGIASVGQAVSPVLRRLGKVFGRTGETAGPTWQRLTIIAATLAALLFASSDFLRHAWQMQPSSVDPRTFPAYRISGWLAANAGNSRVLVAGELEGALNIWTNVPQVGGSHQGLSNYMMAAAQREITFGCKSSPHVAELWLRALAVRYFVVHGPSSSEHFHWWARTDRFNNFPVAWSEAGDSIYAVTEEQQAVVVDLPELRQMGAMQSTADEQYLDRYVRWAHGKRAAAIRWHGPDRADIDANLAPGEAILVKVNYDRGWKVNGRTEPDPIGFLLIHPAAGAPGISLRFGAGWDAWLGRGITVLTLVLLIWKGLPYSAIGVLPGILAYGVLALHTPPQVRLADEAYGRLQPPLINPGGIVDASGKPGPITRGGGFTVYGLNFGTAQQQAVVSVGGRSAEIRYHGPNQFNLTMPADAPKKADVYVWVDGCLGNGFTVETR